jgi:hypothetical protein
MPRSNSRSLHPEIAPLLGDEEGEETTLAESVVVLVDAKHR